MKNKIILILSLSLGMLFVSPNSFAGQVESTTVQSIQAHSDKMTSQAKGLLLYGFADLPTDSPACATDPEGRMIFPFGDNFYSSPQYSSQQYRTAGGRLVGRTHPLIAARVIGYLKEAYDNDSLLDVIGTGDCYLGFEVVQFIILKK